MASGSFIQVTSGAGPKIATGPTYTDESSNVVQDQKILFGIPYHSTFTVAVPQVVATTGNSHMIQVMAGSSLNVYILFLLTTQYGAVGAVSALGLQVLRLTSAGTGGTVITPRPMDTTDAIGATAMSLPTVKGTEGSQLWQQSVWLGTAAIPSPISRFEYPGETPEYLHKPIKILAGTANGICLKNIGSIASSSMDIQVVGIETPF